MASRRSTGEAKPKGKRASKTAKRKAAKRKTAKRKTAKRKTAKRKSKPAAKAGTRAKPNAPKASGVKLLSGGNPQIPKGDGDAPVQAYIAAMPGWKHDVGRWLDKLVERTVPQVRKAVRWNSPFYGVDGQGWFMSVHCYTRAVNVTFFAGTSLEPMPPRPSKHPKVRYFDIHEGERDEAQLASWIEQAAALPGWIP